MIRNKKNEYITYSNMFWLFIVGSLLGVLLEGTFCFVKKGVWETHVVSMFLPLCVLYGMGAVGCYLIYDLVKEKNKIFQFFTYGLVGDIVELITGGALYNGLKMRAWNYTNHLLNYRGYVSFTMTFTWGIVGILFSYLVPYINKVFDKMKHKAWKAISYVFTVFLIFDFSLTAYSVKRWSNRHYNVKTNSSFAKYIDNKFDDKFMEKRFCEWKFLDKK